MRVNCEFTVIDLKEPKLVLLHALIYCFFFKGGIIFSILSILNYNLPVASYGCETWSLTLREERKLRVFENMVLRRIFGPGGTR